MLHNHQSVIKVKRGIYFPSISFFNLFQNAYSNDYQTFLVRYPLEKCHTIIYLLNNVADPEPLGSELICRIRVRNNTSDLVYYVCHEKNAIIIFLFASY